MSATLIQPGATLGNYRIERLLGRGGMGTVFLAHDNVLRRQIALKVIDSTSDSETSRAQLLREARNAAALNHPNICTIHEIGDAQGVAFIAMEYVEGRSLRERLDEGGCTIDDAVGYGVQAADALAYAHAHGVVHRDFKAANAIVSVGGRLKIVDFGLARRNDAMAAGTTTMASIVAAGAIAGTPYAMAPEQIRGELPNARADIWALGVFLHEMVCGTKPFDAGTVPELFSSILRDPPAPLPARVPAAIGLVIARCLNKDPERRYENADDVRAALEAWRSGTATIPAVSGDGLPHRSWRTMAALASIGVVAVLFTELNIGGLRDPFRSASPDSGAIRLAVLPIENLTGDPEQEYFSDGLTEEMTTELGRLHPQRLSVIARTSSMRYKKRGVPVDQIGRELGVDYVLEGSVRREGNRVRIAANLIRVSDQSQRWADSFERELVGILALESDVAGGVAQALALTLLPAEQTRLANAKAVNPDAYEAYLKGQSYAGKLTRSDLGKAEEYFELALQKDPNYALAYAGLAKVWSGRQQMQFVPPSQAAPRMKASAARALELDPTLSEVHHRLANQYAWTDWNWAGAAREFQKAIELGPNNAEAHAFYSHYLHMMKRPDEARVQMRRARELDPLSEQVQSLYAVALGFDRRYSEETTELQAVLKTNPRSPMATTTFPEVLHLTGKYDQALAAEKARWLARDDREIEQALTRGQSGGGYQAAMRLAADALAARPTGVAFVATAKLYARGGQTARALDLLEKAFDARDPNIPYIGVQPIYDSLRTEPRFQSLLRRMNLPG